MTILTNEIWTIRQNIRTIEVHLYQNVTNNSPEFESKTKWCSVRRYRSYLATSRRRSFERDKMKVDLMWFFLFGKTTQSLYRAEVIDNRGYLSQILEAKVKNIRAIYICANCYTMH
uniref:Uncharacterized protein n=1 Tax=Cacopsylla melanoneura TaxID=428564 RepID=A0A8D8TMC2_9HEMI